MAQTILIKRSNTSNAIPSTSQLSLGELALNTADAKLYMRKYVDGTNANDTITLVGDTSTIAATTLTGNLSMGDNIRARFGTSNDLQIYHDGSNSYINDTSGTGNLYLASNQLIINNATNNENMARFAEDGAVTLYNNGVAKFATTNTGIQVTGIVKHADGTVAAPSITFTDDTNTGIYSSTADTVDIATGGVRRAFFNNAGITSVSNVYTASNGDFRNYAGVWEASTGLTGNGFSFVNSIDGTAATISSTGNAVFSGTLTATGYNSTNWNTAYTYSQVGHLPLAGGTLTGNILFNDSVVARWGNGADLKIYHDGTNSYIEDSGTGNLKIRTNALNIMNAANNQSMISAAQGAAVILYYNNSAKLTTTNTGINVSGTANVGGLTVNSAFTLPTADGSANQILKTNGSGTLSWASASAVTQVADADGDTKIQVEESADEDTIRFDAAGVERFKIGSDVQVMGTTDFNITGSNRRISFTSGTGTVRTSGASSLNFGTSNTDRMTITSAGNVGIGTTSPNVNLNLRRETAGNIFAINRVASATNALYVGISGNDTSFYANNGIYKLGINNPTGTGGEIPFITMSPTNRYTTFTAGNVGIGTSAPQTELEISAAQSPFLRLTSEKDGTHDAGDIYGELQFFTQETYGNAPVVSAKIQSLHTRAGTGHSNGDAGLALFTSTATNDATATERMRIESVTGNVGIGTTAPSELLEVKKTTANAIIKVQTGGGNDARLILDAPAAGGAQSQIFFDADGTTAGSIMYQHNSGGTNYMTFGTGGSNTERMRIDSSGNIGIGTSAPTSKVDIRSPNGVTHSRGQLYLTNTDTAAINNGSQISLGGTYSGTSDTYFASIAGRKENATSADYDGYLQFATRANGGSNAERMRITSAGNVGIGTTAPASALSGSNVNLTMEDADGADIRFKHTGGVDFTVGVTSSNTAYVWNGSSHHMLFGTAGTERMRIQSTGNVGIGSTAPDKTLVVQGVSAEIVINDTDSTDTPRLRFRESGSTSGSIHTDASHMMFSAGTTERMRIDATGRLLLNATTTAFGDKLYVNGDAYVTGGWRIGTSATYTGKIYNSSGIMSIETDSNRDIQFGDSGTPAIMYIDTSTENVGIGTTSPAAKLDITGNNTAIAFTFGNTVPNNPLHSNYYGGYSGIGMDQTTAGVRIAGNTGATATSLDIGYYTGGVVSHANWNSSVMVKNDSKVGIGTTAPLHALDVRGLILAGEASTYGTVRFGSDNNSGRWIRGNSAELQVGSNLNNLRMMSTAANYIDSDTVNGTTAFRINARISHTSGNLFEVSNAGANKFAVSHDGKVGIGTDSPTAKLQISHNGGHTSGNVAIANSSLDLYNPLAANTDEKGSILTFSDNYFGGGTSYPRTTRAAIKGGTDTVGNTADGFLAFYTDDGAANSMPERMRINASGNVGIGTSSPGDLLHIADTVSSNALVSMRMQNNLGYAEVGVQSNYVRLLANGVLTYAGASAATYFYNGGLTAMTLNSTGLAIGGSTAPDAKLRIDQDAATLGFKVTGGSGGTDIAQFTRDVSGTGTVGINASGSDPQMYFTSAGNTFALGVNSNTFEISDNSHIGTNTRFSITNTGNVGIGTSSPQAKLHVDGITIFDTATGSQPVYITRLGNTNEALKIHCDDRGAVFESIQDETADTYGNFIFVMDAGVTEPYFDVRKGSADSASIFRVDGGGNVGIGTTAPAAKFQVEDVGIDTTATSTTATTLAQIDTFAAATFRSARYTIQATNSTDSTYHITEVLLIHDGTNAYITEYGTMFTGSSEGTISADIAAGNVRLLVTPASTDTIAWKVVRHSILV